MDRHSQWKIWQLINNVGVRSKEAKQLLKDASEEFPGQTYSQQLENLKKLGFDEAAGISLKKLSSQPELSTGHSKACLPGYLVIPEQIVSLAKQCELLNIRLEVEIYDISNCSPTNYPERLYWIFQVEAHGAGRVHKNCGIDALEKADRCGLNIVEGLALIREDSATLCHIRLGHVLALPGSRCDGLIPYFQVLREDLEKEIADRLIMLKASCAVDIRKGTETFQGISELSTVIIASRAKMVCGSGAARNEHPNR